MLRFLRIDFRIVFDGQTMNAPPRMEDRPACRAVLLGKQNRPSNTQGRQ